MSLPMGGAWPPPPHEIAFAQQAIWSAWLTGDADTLATVYGAASGAGNPAGAEFFNREGGVIPTVARFFWGRPSTSGQRRHKLHVPLAADIVTASADLLFSEPPQFLVDTGVVRKKGKDQEKTPADHLVDTHLNQPAFHAQLLEAAELAAALGGAWLRLVWDKERADHVLVDTVAADAAYGEWWMGELQAVTFFTEYRESANDKKVLRHLERHEPGWILHGLYEGDAKTLGRLVPLESRPETAELAASVPEGLTTAAIETQVPSKRLTAAYAANMRPQRRWRKLEALAKMGRSDYDGVEPLMDSLDECYTSWMRDLRLAKARIIVPEFMLQNLGKGKGATFDEDQEIYAKLNIAPTEDKSPQITPKQFEIRFEAHQATANQLIDHILESAGYSPSTFGRGGEGAKTATEVVSRERQSERTRDKKTRYWGKALEPFLSTWIELENVVYSARATGEVKTNWPPSSQPDQEALARTVQALRQAEAASTDTLVRMQHPDWDEEDITAEVAQILKEAGRDVPDLGPLPDDEGSDADLAGNR